ncbi:MAG: hypothetical protein KME46_23270 [Brasilonema angustatum HA4187-MV1]|jgi:hypothetical protein|nr:hypothetical protein [Brasilonema angustatum HA4187-MV1]
MSLGFKSQVDENASLRIVQDFSCYEVIVEAYFLNASNNSTDGKIAFVAQALEATLYSHPTTAAYVEHSQK